MIDPVIKMVQEEDLIRWSLAPAQNFALEHLWYPKFCPLSLLGLFLFFHND